MPQEVKDAATTSINAGRTHYGNSQGELFLLTAIQKTYGYIFDIVAMILFVALEGTEMVYNVGGRDSVSILDLATKIARYFKIQCEVPEISSKLSYIGNEPIVLTNKYNKKNQKNVYTNGAMTVPCERKIRAPRPMRKMKMGVSHHFFLALIKS